VRGQFDRINWARFFAHAAINAAQFIDIKLLGIFFAVFPRAFFGHDVNAICGASRRAHETCNASNATIFIFIQTVNTAEGRPKLSAFFDWSIVAFLFWILHDPQVLFIRSITPDIFDKMSQSCAETLDDAGNEETLAQSERLRSDIDNLIVWDRHSGRG
jgi:hypothetical protein